MMVSGIQSYRKILQIRMLESIGKKKFKLLCVLILLTGEVNLYMVQHQHRLQMKQWKIKLAAVFFPSSGKICNGKCSADRGKT